MLLILQVMRPQSVEYDEIENAESPAGLRGKLWKRAGRRSWYRPALESPLFRWKNVVSKQQDMYLPCGVACLSDLRDLTVVEEMTLVALARATENASEHSVRDKLGAACTARAARLYELRAAEASIVALGAYYKVRARSTLATYGGATFGFLGVILVIAAVAWPIQ